MFWRRGFEVATSRLSGSSYPATAEAPLFDHLVGAHQKRLGDFQPDRFCRLEIDDEFELGRLHHRQVSRFGAGKDLAGIDSGLAVTFGKLRAVTDETADFGEFAAERHRRQFVTQSKSCDMRAVGAVEGIVASEHGADLLLVDLAKAVSTSAGVPALITTTLMPRRRTASSTSCACTVAAG